MGEKKTSSPIRENLVLHLQILLPPPSPPLSYNLNSLVFLLIV